MANPKVFISYSRNDRSYVEKLVTALQKKGMEVWFDYHLLSGQDWDDTLEEQIKTCDYMIIVLSKTSVASVNVKNELRFAMDLEKKIHPILIEECSVPLSMRRMHYVDFMALGFKDGVTQLVGDVTSKGESKINQNHKPLIKSKNKNILKQVGLGVIGLLLLVFLYLQFGKTKPSNDANVNPIVEASSEWSKIDSLSNLKAYINYLSRYGNSEGQKHVAIKNVRKMLQEEGAVTVKRDQFNSIFDNQFFIRDRDTLYETNTAGDRYIKPESGDLLIALEKIAIMNPSTMTERGGFYLMPGDIIQFNQIINSDSDEIFFSYYYTTHDVSEATNSKIEIIGNHVYWNKGFETEYNYNAMTSLAYYNYEINANTGKPYATNGWETSEIPGMAKRNGKEVLLTVSMFGSSNLQQFLGNKRAIEMSITSIINSLEKREANGVILNFTDVPNRWSTQMTAYIKSLTTKLKKKNSTYKCLVILPFLDVKNTYNIVGLSPYVDYFIIGINESNKSQEISGPVTTFAQFKKAIGFYLKRGVPTGKLIVTISYYGSQWEIKTNGDGTHDYAFSKSLTYSDIKDKYPYENAIYDEEAVAMYLDVTDSERQYRIWFESQQSLAKKYDFVLNTNIAGISIWALGYDKTHNDLENVLLYKLIDR